MKLINYKIESLLSQNGFGSDCLGEGFGFGTFSSISSILLAKYGIRAPQMGIIKIRKLFFITNQMKNSIWFHPERFEFKNETNKT